MILGNKTETPRAVYAGREYVDVPPMGIVTIPDEYADEVKAAIQPLLDAGIFVINQKIKENERPVKVESPKAPVELDAEPENPKVHTKRPRTTGETVKV